MQLDELAIILVSSNIERVNPKDVSKHSRLVSITDSFLKLMLKSPKIISLSANLFNMR